MLCINGARSRCMEALRVTYSSSRLHVVFTLLFVELALFFGGCVLVLLVLRDQIVHVALGFSELHLVHTLASVPVEESLPSEHGGELLGNTFEQLLDGGRVTDEGGPM